MGLFLPTLYHWDALAPVCRTGPVPVTRNVRKEEKWGYTRKKNLLVSGLHQTPSVPAAQEQE